MSYKLMIEITFSVSTGASISSERSVDYSLTQTGTTVYRPPELIDYYSWQTISLSFGGKTVTVEKDALEWMRKDIRLFEFVIFVAYHVSWPIRVEVYRDYEDRFEELHVTVQADGDPESIIREWRELEKEIAQNIPLDIRLKAAVIYCE